jgi:hypothetical protein
VDEDALWASELKVRRLLDRVKATRRIRKNFPGRYPEAVPLDVPPWHFAEADDEEMVLTGLKASK